MPITTMVSLLASRDNQFPAGEKQEEGCEAEEVTSVAQRQRNATHSGLRLASRSSRLKQRRQNIVDFRAADGIAFRKAKRDRALHND